MTMPNDHPTTNEAFRAHVTSTTFVLTLGATHIAALAHVAHQLARNQTLDEDAANGTLDQRARPASGALRRAFAHGVTGMNGLIARGLVTYHHEVQAKPVGTWRPSEAWTITRAGQLVIALLAEAGIWQEYADALPSPDLAAVPS